MIGESQRICDKTATVQSTYSRISMFTNLEQNLHVHELRCSWFRPFVNINFDIIIRPFVAVSDERPSGWLVCFPRPPCFCAHNSHLKSSSFIKWRRLLPCFMEWNPPSVTQYILCLKNICFVEHKFTCYLYPPPCGAAAPRRPWPPHSWGFYITHNDASQSVGLL